MTLKLDTVAQTCQSVSLEIQDAYKDLALHYIIFHEGQHLEALSLSAQQIVHHPAVDKALHMMKNTEIPSVSTYIGTVIENQRVMGGMSNREALLSLFSINIDQFDSLKDVTAYAYHLAWHGINASETRKKMAYKEKRLFSTMLPSNNFVEAGISNLQADAFSAIMCSFHGDRNAVTRLASIRGQQALDRNPHYRPETYPFTLGMEATKFAMGEYLKRSPSKRKRIHTALKLSREIAASLDTDTIKHWLAFAEPAQEMAWQNHSPETILGSAIYVSQSTHVRATGHLVAELSGIKPVSILETSREHSAFAEDKINAEIHNKAIDEIFDKVVARGLIESSSAPFYEEANRQNEALMEGRILGWCASSLQQAALSFENALVNGRTPAEQAAREKFQDERQKTTWDQLKQLGREIIRQCRLGKEMTFDNLAKACDLSPQYEPMAQAVKLTVNDPVYIQSLESVNDLSRIPKPAAPMPASPAPATPAAALRAAPSMGMGGGGGSSGLAAPKREKETGTTANTTHAEENQDARE